jgi:hypothetical protein
VAVGVEGLSEALGRVWHALDPNRDAVEGVVAVLMVVVVPVPVVDEVFVHFRAKSPFRAPLDCKALPEKSSECLQQFLCWSAAVLNRCLSSGL